MKKTVFIGAATAIITPLNEQGVDYEQFGRLIDWQIAEGIDAIVAVGTTGEGSTLSDEEHKEAIRFCVERVAGRVPVIAGTGSNDVAYAIQLTEFACEVGADAMLLVTPYYNKATQKGMIESFRAIADASTKPCILYNVPSRTGCNLTPASAAVLAEHPNIVAIKEACGNISQIAELAALVGDKMDIYSGNDDQYAWLAQFVNQTVTVEVAACNWNNKTYWAGCVLSVITDDGKVLNTLNFDANK